MKLRHVNSTKTNEIWIKIFNKIFFYSNKQSLPSFFFCQREREKSMGNIIKKQKPVFVETRRKQDFPLQLQLWSTGWNFTQEHKAAVEEAFSRHNIIQDVLTVFLEILGEHNDYQAYHRLTRPNLYDINNANDYYISEDWLRSNKAIRISVMGYGGSGKSALVIRSVTDNFLDEYDPTISDSYNKTCILNESARCSLYILDTAAREELPSMYESWVREADCVIIVYNISGPYTPEDAINSYLSIVHRTKKIPVIIAGTKVDLSGSMDKYKTNLDFVIDFCKRNNLCYVETSAKTGMNVDFLFQIAAYELWFQSFQD
ncbi:hypothetical protein RFI_23849 [Reticulomyxa filosa]|uniref:Uncharacterized protein n=1 Tax=Reticulomyxa filosa TaxID=46433 RepID=X6MI27_RETFI|nr:hypothetical protein RFI_23849 [Reticulomyxa filosa]|eukprot:ETO13519.1 hypothetical protein RFI_23849 [Reticulomyxa filosa]